MPKPFTPEDESWQQHRWSEAQKIPERIEDAAKFLATMISLSLTLGLTVGKEAVQGGDYGPRDQVLWALGCWLLALIPAFLTLMPRYYRLIPGSTSEFRKMHQRVIRYKFSLLVVSAFLFFLGFLIFFIRLVVAG